jgi:hypothetical protein
MDPKQPTPENVVVYDLGEIAEHSEPYVVTSGPESTIVTPDEIATQVVRLAIRETVKPLFEGNPERFQFVDTCIGELVQDVERHGDGPKRVTLVRGMGGIAIETENCVSMDDHKFTGFGKAILERVFKQHYSAGLGEDGVFRAHVFIPRDPIDQQILDVSLSN